MPQVPVTKKQEVLIRALAKLGPNGGLVAELADLSCSLPPPHLSPNQNHRLILDTLEKNGIVDSIKFPEGRLFYLTEQGWAYYEENIPVVLR